MSSSRATRQMGSAERGKSPSRIDARQAGKPEVAGQVFADILLLAALSCDAPFAVVSVPQAGGGWSTLSHGFDQRVALDGGRLFAQLTEKGGPAEIAVAEVARDGQTIPDVRWAYGTALRGPSGAVLGVVAVLDRSERQATGRDHRALLAIARQLVLYLLQVQRVTARGGRGPTSLSREDGHHLLRSHEVAVLFDVTERTVINWAASGRLPSLRTAGGHLRFRSEDVLALVAGANRGGAANSKAGRDEGA